MIHQKLSGTSIRAVFLAMFVVAGCTPPSEAITVGKLVIKQAESLKRERNDFLKKFDGLRKEQKVRLGQMEADVNAISARVATRRIIWKSAENTRADKGFAKLWEKSFIVRPSNITVAGVEAAAAVEANTKPGPHPLDTIIADIGKINKQLSKGHQEILIALIKDLAKETKIGTDLANGFLEKSGENDKQAKANLEAVSK